MIYNPLDTFYKSQIGAVNAKETITFRVKGNFDSVIFQFKKDGCDVYDNVAMQKDGEWFSVELSLSVGLYFYRFTIGNGFYISNGKHLLGEITNTPNDYQLTVYESDFCTPNWVKGGVIYQIFPDRLLM